MFLRSVMRSFVRANNFEYPERMIFRRHVPGPPLDQWIDFFWFYEGFYPDHSREHVLPDGTFELVINLQDEPRKLFDRQDSARHESFRGAWMSGTHSGYIVIDALPNSSMMGAHFKPGGAAAFVDAPAFDLANRVVDLEALWGFGVRELRERLMEALNPESKFRILESSLLERLARWRTAAENHRRVNWALEQFLKGGQVGRIGDMARAMGFSHKHFVHQFRQQVGLTPKLFCRIRRFQEVLGSIKAKQPVLWADLACSCGYYDQAHFINDFQTFAGLNPSEFLASDPEDPRFVPLRSR
jgi:AraC-like DNA-binding protein